MYGTGERFTYLECDACGTLQIAETPSQMSRYYPENYYSFRDLWVHKSKLRTLIKRAILPIALKFPKSPAGAYFKRHAPWLLMVPGITRHSRILDVGCGKGHLLHLFRLWGFTDLHGADPYIAEDTILPGLSIRKAHLTELGGQYDLVMMHHSLEHVEFPVQLLADATDLLAPGGAMVIRIPVKGGYLWETYGADWAQLDAPRHFTLFTKDAFLRTVEDLGLKRQNIIFDAEAFSLRGSEAIKRTGHLSCSFSAEEEAEFERKIRHLNESAESDQACFILRRQ